MDQQQIDLNQYRDLSNKLVTECENRLSPNETRVLRDFFKTISPDQWHKVIGQGEGGGQVTA